MNFELEEISLYINQVVSNRFDRRYFYYLSWAILDSYRYKW